MSPRQTETARDESWRKSALCAQTDPAMFFPGPGTNTTRKAKQTCNACTVLAQCREYALTSRQAYGVWGGLSAPERERLLAQRKGVA